MLSTSFPGNVGVGLAYLSLGGIVFTSMGVCVAYVDFIKGVLVAYVDSDATVMLLMFRRPARTLEAHECRTLA